MDHHHHHPHPLHQIASTPTHNLLLKQWLKEQNLTLTRISLKESQIDSTRNQITTLYSIFFLFHSTSLLFLFTSATTQLCSKSWVPSIFSLLFSLGFIWAIRYKNDVESHLEKMLEREKEDSRLLEKCVEELKRKGSEFDLLKEVDALRRAKSLKVAEIGQHVTRWSMSDFVIVFLFVVSCLVLLMNRVVLCS